MDPDNYSQSRVSTKMKYTHNKTEKTFFVCDCSGKTNTLRINVTVTQLGDDILIFGRTNRYIHKYVMHF